MKFRSIFSAIGPKGCERQEPRRLLSDKIGIQREFEWRCVSVMFPTYKQTQSCVSDERKAAEKFQTKQLVKLNSGQRWPIDACEYK